MTIDYRPGGRVLQGPPMMAAIAAAPSENPYGCTQLVEGRWPDAASTVCEVTCTKNTLRRFGRGEPPPLGSDIKFVGEKGTLTAKIVGYLAEAKLPMGWPSVFANPTAFAVLKDETHGTVAFWKKVPEHAPDDLLTAESEREREEKISYSFISGMVQIPGKDYKMGKTEVTQAQWEAVMGRTPSYFKNAENPVENVSWNDCQEFLKKLNALPAVKESGLVFRLPTEEEWEYACRAGSAGDYCKLADGRDITESTLGEVAWYGDNSGHKTHPAGQKKPNAFGLYDMHGNVWEWCEDLYRADDSDRVLRGGSWVDDSSYCRASNRSCDTPDCRDYFLGFRLAASQDVNR